MHHIPTLLQIVNFFGLGYDPKGLAEVSGILTVVALLIVIVVGLVIDLLEHVELKILGKIFGRNFAVIFHNYITFPGLFMHETAHALMALVTGAKITEYHLFDRGGDSLGHVSYRNRGLWIFRAVQDCATACAPVLAGLVLGYFTLRAIFVLGYPLWADILLWYLFLSILTHASMSGADLKIYFKAVWVLAIPVFCVFFFLCSHAAGQPVLFFLQ